MQVESLELQALSPTDAMQAGELVFATWPPQNQPDARPQPVANFTGYTGPHNRRPRAFVIRDGGRIVSQATVQAREIEIAGRRYTVAGLGGVCTYMQYRGRGYGTAVVRAVFDLVDAGDFGFSLFQTGIAAYYEKLNCRCIPNPIVNSLNKKDPNARPFWDTYVMIYPARLQLPPDPIDLRGPGY